jgi:hypothetical protein
MLVAMKLPPLIALLHVAITSAGVNAATEMMQTAASIPPAPNSTSLMPHAVLSQHALISSRA